MGTFAPFAEDLPFEEKVKCLADEELLEIWQESQQVEFMLSMNLPSGVTLSSSYEKVILNELEIRLKRRLIATSRPHGL